ncbi:MAG: AraC family transcriptional regulator [Paludibacteraceae bacterium]|nr:AraC family transcriptional regulator [Paludibacteraceae bacterium]
MFTPFVTDEQPVALYEGVPPQYTNEGLAIDCALVLHVRKGTARIRCNLEVIEETIGSVVLFNPGDVIKVEQRSHDYEAEIVAVNRFIHLAALNQLEGVNVQALKKTFILDTPEISSAADGLVRVLRPAIRLCSTRELYQICVMQLRAFYTLYQVILRRNGIEVDTFKNRADELFFRFRQLLAENYRTSRSVGFYAGKLCITTRYLTGIVQSHYGKSPKEAIDIYTVMQLRLDLLQSDETLAELSYRYNFSSPAFLSDYFKRNTGIAPQEYRQLNHTNAPNEP